MFAGAKANELQTDKVKSKLADQTNIDSSAYDLKQGKWKVSFDVDLESIRKTPYEFKQSGHLWKWKSEQLCTTNTIFLIP